MASSSPVNVGIAGAGYVSTHHIKALRMLPGVNIVALCDMSLERAREVAARHQIPHACTTLAEMRHLRPDVIHVLTPPSSHCALTLEALAMGCHVFVEKPMAPTVRECDDMIEAARQAGRVLSINHSAKDDPVVVEALRLVKSGAIGDVLSVDFCRGSDYPPYPGGPMGAPYRLGGYPFEDIGIHGLYLVEAFLGEIKTLDVRHRSSGKHTNVHFDEWHARVDCANGIGQMLLSWSARPMRNELYVHGTRGYLHIDCFLQTCAVHKALPGPKAITASIDGFVHAAATLYKVPRNMLRFVTGKLRPSPGIVAGVINFHEALRNGTAPPVTPDEGRRMVGWVEGPCRSADADRERELRIHERVPPATTLVTGAAGILGRALITRLVSQGQSVRILIRRPNAALEQLPGVHAVYGDLGDPDAVERAVSGVRLVYHVGATMRGRGWPDFEAGTVWGTRNVVESCLKHGVQRLVHVSSLTVLDYATPAPRTVVREDAALEPHPDWRGAYTKSKLEAEQIVLSAVRDRGLPAVVLRPGQIYGPGTEQVPPYGTIAMAGRWMVIGSGNMQCPLVHVNDVVDGMLLAAARDGVVGSVFHLVDSNTTTQDRYIDDCRRSGVALPPVMHVPRWFLFTASMGVEMLGRVLKRGVPLSRYRVRSINELRFDCSLAEETLQWRKGAATPSTQDSISVEQTVVARGGRR